MVSAGRVNIVANSVVTIDNRIATRKDRILTGKEEEIGAAEATWVLQFRTIDDFYQGQSARLGN